METKDYVEAYRSLGFAVIPAKPLSKAAAVKWKQYEQRKPSDDEIEYWLKHLWSRGYNIAIICGEVSNLVVIDLDTYNAPEVGGLMSIDALAEHTMVVHTPSGGWHIYLRMNRPYPSFSITYRGKTLIEVRSNARYVLAPPSKAVNKLTGEAQPYELHPKSRLELVTPKEDVRELLLRKVEEKLGIRPEYHAEGDRLEELRVSLRGKPYRGAPPPCIEHLLPGVPKGVRNEALCRLASFLLYFRHMKPEKALNLLLAWNENNRPPLPEREVRQAFQSVLKHGYTYGCHGMRKVSVCDRKRCPLKPLKPLGENAWW